MYKMYTRFDDSLKAWNSHNHVHKAQGNNGERLAGYFASHKVLERFGVKIYTQGLEKIKAEEGKRVLLLPNHRSYLDPVLVHHVLGCAGIPQPKVAALDFLASTPLASWFRKCGAVFIKGSFRDPDYRERMNSTLRSFADEGELLEFYPEGMRSLSGKQMEAKHGLLKGMMDGKDCVIYPISLSYTRLIEDREFISKGKGFSVKQTASSLFLPSQGAGPVYFTVGDAIRTSSTDDPKEVAKQVTTAILQNNLIHSTDVVATLLLHRQEAVGLRELIDEVEWFTEGMRARGLQCTEEDTEGALSLLSHCVSVKKGVVKIKDKTLLIYYRNRILYTMGDLISLPSVLRKEVLWTPSLPLPETHEKKMKEIAVRAFEPTVFLYKYLADQLKEEGTVVKDLKRSIEDNPHCCHETVANFLSALQEDGLVRVEEGIVYKV